MPFKRLVLADDNPAILETLTDMLQPSYEVVDALSDGQSVLERLPELSPDVLILDISLPDMTGFDVLRQLKKNVTKARVIFLTVHENIDFVRAAFDLGAVGYVYKSRIGSDLIPAIDAACSGGLFSSAEVSLPT